MHRIRIKLTTLAVITLGTCSILGCKQESGRANQAKIIDPKFFDLKGYFEKEAQRLSIMSKVVKTVTIGGLSESRVVDNLDFKKELAFFANSDIKRPAWSDKYRVDTIFNDAKEVTQLSYKTTGLDEDLKVKSIQVDFVNGLVDKVSVESSVSNSLTKYKQALMYQPSKGYNIECLQNALLDEEQVLIVDVKF